MCTRVPIMRRPGPLGATRGCGRARWPWECQRYTSARRYTRQVSRPVGSAAVWAPALATAAWSGDCAVRACAPHALDCHLRGGMGGCAAPAHGPQEGLKRHTQGRFGYRRGFPTLTLSDTSCACCLAQLLGQVSKRPCD